MVDRDDNRTSLAQPLWPLMLAAFVSMMPLTASRLFVASIADDLQTTPAVVGGLFGLVGAAALLVGFVAAPLIDRAPRALAVSFGLLLIAIADLVVTVGQVTGLVAFYLLFGLTSAALAPTLQAASADGRQESDAGRATSRINSANPLAAVLGGPLLAGAASVAGWQGAYLAIGVAAVCLALVCALRLDRRRPLNVARVGYRQAFAIVARSPGAVPLLAASALRGCALFAWITFLAAFYANHFGASTALVALVWVLTAATLSLTNLIAGNVANPSQGPSAAGWRSPTRLLVSSSWAWVVLAPLVFVSPTFPLALAATVGFAIVWGASQAALISVLIRRYAEIRGAVMGLNAAAVNAGTIAGASIAGASLGFGGYPGLAVTLIGTALVAAVVMQLALRSVEVGTMRQAPVAV